jgi:hypothetical protein
VLAWQPIGKPYNFWSPGLAFEITLLSVGVLSFESLEWLESDYSDIVMLAKSGRSILVEEYLSEKPEEDKRFLNTVRYR